jgi:hypothetical protein
MREWAEILRSEIESGQPKLADALGLTKDLAADAFESAVGSLFSLRQAMPDVTARSCRSATGRPTVKPRRLQASRATGSRRTSPIASSCSRTTRATTSSSAKDIERSRPRVEARRASRPGAVRFDCGAGASELSASPGDAVLRSRVDGSRHSTWFITGCLCSAALALAAKAAFMPATQSFNSRSRR